VNSGTSALLTALSGLGIGPGDEVIVPSMTFVATVNAVAYTGAHPVFAEIADLTRPWLTPSTVEPLINQRTRAILTVAYGGHPGDTPQLRALADSYRLFLFEDAAHAVGASARGQAVGTVGTAAAFSFFSNKNLAVGEGGMVVTSDKEIAERIRLLRSHGMTTLTWDRHRGHAAGYDVVALGYNYRIDEPRATLGRLRLSKLEEENAARTRAVARYRSELVDVAGISLLADPDPGDTSANHLFPIVLDEGIDREALRAALSSTGVQTSVHYPPVHHFSIYHSGAPDLPRTDAYGAREVTLPLFAHITEEQQARVIDSATAALTDTGVVSG
jgi:dTDP-4-amino-4,6-dideoxygalactose transaminase